MKESLVKNMFKYGASFESTATVYLVLISILIFKNIKVSRDKAEHKTTICSGGVAIPSQTPAFLTSLSNNFSGLIKRTLY